jgi:hypothetical protein
MELIQRVVHLQYIARVNLTHLQHARGHRTRVLCSPSCALIVFAIVWCSNMYIKSLFTNKKNKDAIGLQLGVRA